MIDKALYSLATINGWLKTTIVIILIIILTIMINNIIRKFMRRKLKKSTGLLRVDPTQYNFLKHFVTALIYIMGLVAIIYNIPSLRTFSVSILAGAGVLAVIIGFASQQAFSNIVSGIFIVLFRPFSVGDRLRIGNDIYGVVEDITLRHTIIQTFENKRVIVPNSIINNEKLENSDLEDERICKWFEIGISYDSNIDKAKKIIQEEAEKHQNTIDIRTEEDKENKIPIVKVRVLKFDDSAVILKAWIWTDSQGEAFVLGCDLNESVKKRFDKEGIEIPFPYRTIVYKKDQKTKRTKKVAIKKTNNPRKIVKKTSTKKKQTKKSTSKKTKKK
jgi:small-conductance mechanosensitive channel